MTTLTEQAAQLTARWPDTSEEPDITVILEMREFCRRIAALGNGDGLPDEQITQFWSESFKDEPDRSVAHHFARAIEDAVRLPLELQIANLDMRIVGLVREIAAGHAREQTLRTAADRVVQTVIDLGNTVPTAIDDAAASLLDAMMNTVLGDHSALHARDLSLINRIRTDICNGLGENDVLRGSDIEAFFDGIEEELGEST